MGNCSLRPPVTWADDGGENEEDEDDDRKDEKFTARSKARTIAPCSTKVRIKINRKQLEELLSRARVRRMSVLDLLSLGEVSFEAVQMHCWRPALQSIPEEEGFGAPL